MNKKMFFISVIIFIAFHAALYAVMVHLNAAAVPRSSISFRVLNGVVSNAPVSGVRIVIPEADTVLLTDENGLTDTANVPVLRNVSPCSALSETWGEISVLAYKDGFADYALFHVQVYPDSIRSEVPLLLFPENDDTVFSLIESPPPAWVEELLDKYRDYR